MATNVNRLRDHYDNLVAAISGESSGQLEHDDVMRSVALVQAHALVVIAEELTFMNERTSPDDPDTERS